jgi:hypothetical protein
MSAPPPGGSCRFRPRRRRGPSTAGRRPRPQAAMSVHSSVSRPMRTRLETRVATPPIIGRGSMGGMANGPAGAGQYRCWSPIMGMVIGLPSPGRALRHRPDKSSQCADRPRDPCHRIRPAEGVLDATGQAIRGHLVAELPLVGLDVLEANLCVHRSFPFGDDGLMLDGHILAWITALAIARSPSYRPSRPFIWAAPLVLEPLDRNERL